MRRLMANPGVRLGAVLLLGLVLRLLAIRSPERPLVFDERDYSALSTTLAHSGAYSEAGHPTAYRAPGYPAFLASVQILTHRSDPRPARIAQAVLDESSACVLYLIALPWGSTAALLSAAIWSFYPPAVVYARLLYPETLFTFLLLLWLLLATRLRRERAWEKIALGAGVGLLALVKTEAAFLLLTVPAGALIRGAHARVFALFLLGGALALMPWVIRNTRVMGAPVLVTSAGPVFLIGNHPRATGGYSPDVPDSMLPRSTGEVAASRESFRGATRFISANPLRFATLGIKKTALLFASEVELAVTAFHKDPDDPSTRFRQKARELPAAIAIGLTVAYAALLLSGWLGFILAPDDRVAWLAAAILAAWVMAHFLTFGGSRYHHTLMPLAALGAARLASSPRPTAVPATRMAAFLAIAVMLALTLALELRALLRP